MNDDDVDLGACCACEIENDTVRNVVCLHEVAPIPGTGWGCFQCGIAMNGAVAVLCDDCISKKTTIRFVILGFASNKQRTLRDPNAREFNHDMSKHPEASVNN